MKLKRKHQSERFLSFFDKRRKTERDFEEQMSSVLNVLPFFCKQGVSLAPMQRRKALSKEIHDSLLMEVLPVDRLYLSTVKPRTVEKVNLNRAKLFQFHDNLRPPYYGTWRKRSAVITGRKPFARDTEILDYEVDSDEEWEIPEGDDCDESTMTEEDEEESDRSSDSDGFIVQHGYLSEGEGEDEQDRIVRCEDSDKRAERLRALANEWKRSLERKSKKFKKPIVPLLWGPHFKLSPKNVPKEVERATFFEYSDDDDDVKNHSGGDSSSDSSHDDVYLED
uniref:Chromatin assembly factor 1 subunit A n=1 Tax=Elaeophora elaphi TaxID=1147741 RepID=A0A0R3S5X2_9BILA